jgi:hypothetical protein
MISKWIISGEEIAADEDEEIDLINLQHENDNSRACLRIKIELISPSRAAVGWCRVRCLPAHRRLTGLASMRCFLDGARVSVTITRNTRFVTFSIDRAINVPVEFNFDSRCLYARHVDDARPENGRTRKPTRTKLLES